MVRHRRKLLAETLLLGVALSLIVIVAERAGLVRPLENWFSDQRTLRCQQFTPAPTTQLVHLDIDDRALDLVKWPWPRSMWADIYNELARAKPKAVASDIVFPDPQPPTVSRREDGSLESIDDDALFAAAVQKLGCAIMPATLFSDREIVSPLAKAMLLEFQTTPEITEAALTQAMRRRGLVKTEDARTVSELFFSVRREAVFGMVYALLTSSSSATTQPADAVRSLLKLPAAEMNYSSPLTKLVASEFTRARTVVMLRQLAAIKPAGSPVLATASGGYSAPVLPLAMAAHGMGFVDKDFLNESAMRGVPLLAEHDGRVYPQLGLALALQCLDTNVKSVQFTADSISIPLKTGGNLVVPVRTGEPNGREHGLPMLLDIPWFGTRDWATMYDYPDHKRIVQHVPILKLWEVHQAEEKIRFNNHHCDVAIRNMLDRDPPDAQVQYRLGLDPEKAAKYFAKLPELSDCDARIQIATSSLKDLDESGWLDQYKEQEAKHIPLTGDDKTERDMILDAQYALRLTVGETQSLRQQVAAQRAELADNFGGKAILIGWTASSVAADFVPTPLHDRCPGVVVHGAVFNAVMTSHFWRQAPFWVGIGITVCFGIITAGMSVGLSAGRALISALFMLAAYVLLNGLVVFGYFRMRLPLATPALSIGFVWAMCTLYRIIIETQERDHIKARFQTYADPMLVDHVLEHPDKVRFDGEVKELTVAFTDLANFTSISEELGERSVALLNEYLGAMVPIIREHNGFVNKFFGDGIMFFYGAPVENPRHAADAVKTVLDMQTAMGPLNERMAEQGFPQLTVRAGICTGNMVVGDAGTRGRSDYTVLGDAVNLGSRLEGANKTLGTLVLVNARTAATVEGQYLFRPVGRLRVVGKTEAVEVFEAMCSIAKATDFQKRTVDLTTEMVNTYKAGRLQECCDVTTALDDHLKTTGKLTQFYRELCDRFLREPPLEWDGTVVLVDK